MMDFNFFGSIPKLNLIGRKRSNSKSQKSSDQNVLKTNNAAGNTSNVTEEEIDEEQKTEILRDVKKPTRQAPPTPNINRRLVETKEPNKETTEDIKKPSRPPPLPPKTGERAVKTKAQNNETVGDDNQLDSNKNNEENSKLDMREAKQHIEDGTKSNENKTLDEEEIEARDKFEMEQTTFYRVLTKSFYDQNLTVLKPYQKSDNALKTSPKRGKKLTKTLKERKLVISSPQNFHKVENELTMLLRKEAENLGIGTLKKSASMDDLLGDSSNSSDERNMFRTFEKSKLEFSSVGDISDDNGRYSNVKSINNNLGRIDKEDGVEILDSSIKNNKVFSVCTTCGDSHNLQLVFPEDSKHSDSNDQNSDTSVRDKDNESDVLSQSEEDIDKIVEEYYRSNLITMRDKSQSTPELLKSINQFPKDRIERSEHKFPLDDENIEVRRKPSIRRNRISKTTDFDVGRRRQDSPINPKNFDIRGIVKFQLPGQPIITKLNQEYVAYENENFYRINEKTKAKELLVRNVILKSVRYLNSKSKESKEVELRDIQNVPYILYFDSIKFAKQFMDNEKIQVYVSDNKVTIKKTLLRFLGKRSSREILEKKGIYKNEPIFGNTLRDIYMKGAAKSESPVPMFIYKVIQLIEKPENIKSLGLYRTSGNLATIQKIRFEVDNGRLDILDQFSKDPDVLTGSLKLFFRELKEPLIPCEVCEKLMEITKLDPKQMSPKDHQTIKSTLVKNLHEANLQTFFVVMRHLLEVVKYKEHNKMDTYNLAVCWGPSMIFSVHGANIINAVVELSKDIVTQSHDATRLVDFLLGYYELYPSELSALSHRPESITEKILALKRQESRDSVESSDSSKSQKKSSSNLSLSIDEVTKKIIEIIEPHLSTEGLYQRSGSSDKTNKIVKKLNKKKINELDKYKNDVHDLTEALKKYLKEQDGLVKKEMVESVLRATSDNSQNYLEPITRRKVISLIEDSPKKDTFIFLLRHLAKVIDHQTRHNVSKNEIINTWTNVLNYQKKCHVSNDDFFKFLAVAIEVFNDNLPDIVRSSFNNNGSSPNRNEIMGEVVKQIKHHQERDRNSTYENVINDASGEASILDEKTEQTKL